MGCGVKSGTHQGMLDNAISSSTLERYLQISKQQKRVERGKGREWEERGERGGGERGEGGEMGEGGDRGKEDRWGKEEKGGIRRRIKGEGGRRREREFERGGGGGGAGGN